MSKREVKNKDEVNGPGLAVWLIRLVIFGIVLIACLLAFLLFYTRWQDTQLGGIAPSQSVTTSLDPIERFYLRAYLSMNTQELNSPLSSQGGSIVFVIEPGENAVQIASNLVEAGLLTDFELFRRYVRYYGLDSGLEAGTFSIDTDMSLAELATVLTDARDKEVELRFIEGWRFEQMADYLRQLQPANVDELTKFATHCSRGKVFRKQSKRHS